MSDSQDAMLTGLKVLDCGENVSAPYAAKLMADLGAEVIKVEPPVVGDVARSRGPYPRDHEGDREQSGLFLALNTNKLRRDHRLGAFRRACTDRPPGRAGRRAGP